MSHPRGSLPAWTLLVVAASGCHFQVVPPPPPSDPVPIHLVDYGKHISLVVPCGEQELAEYSYGEYDWYARGQKEWWRVIPVLLWPSQGVLGRRIHEHVQGAEDLARSADASTIFTLEVSKQLLEELAMQIEAQRAAAADTALFNPVHQMEFVHYPHDYCISYHCNTVVAEWLEQLGCEVSGCLLFAHLRVLPPAEP